MKKLLLVFIILLTVITKVFAFESYGSSSDNSELFLPILFCIVVLFLVLTLFLPKLRVLFLRKRWEELSFEEQCAQLALDLKNGKRKWYLNNHGNSFTAVPLSAKNIDEMGACEHILTDEVRIKQLITEGKIDNVPTFWTIMKYLNKINSKK